jgi:hypothetical protein
VAIADQLQKTKNPIIIILIFGDISGLKILKNNASRYLQKIKNLHATSKIPTPTT